MDPVDSMNYFDVDCKTYTASSFNSEIRPDCFTILHHNVRSFNKNFDLLGSFMDMLSVRIPIIVLSETWFSRDSVWRTRSVATRWWIRKEQEKLIISIFEHV